LSLIEIELDDDEKEKSLPVLSNVVYVKYLIVLITFFRLL